MDAEDEFEIHERMSNVSTVRTPDLAQPKESKSGKKSVRWEIEFERDGEEDMTQALIDSKSARVEELVEYLH